MARTHYVPTSIAAQVEALCRQPDSRGHEAAPTVPPAGNPISVAMTLDLGPLQQEGFDHTFIGSMLWARWVAAQSPPCAR